MNIEQLLHTVEALQQDEQRIIQEQGGDSLADLYKRCFGTEISSDEGTGFCLAIYMLDKMLRQGYGMQTTDDDDTDDDELKELAEASAPARIMMVGVRIGRFIEQGKQMNKELGI